MSDNYFSDLNKVDVSKHVEKKGGFSYLSWAYAVGELKKRYPAATWEIKRFDGLPYQKTELGYFVEACVTVEGVTHCQIHPVLDNRNKPLASPTVFDINTSNQRALVKAIALHGLGLYIYAGEDLPEKEAVPKITTDQVDKEKITNTVKWFKDKIDIDDLEANWHKVQNVWGLLNSNEQMEVDAQLKDKAPESNIMYKNLLKKYLEYTPEEGVK